MSILLWLLYALIAYLAVPILACWLLFGYAWARGWRSNRITPAHIIELIIRGVK